MYHVFMTFVNKKKKRAMNACIVIVSLETLNAFKVSPIKESSDDVQIGDTKTYTQDGDNHYS